MTIAEYKPIPLMDIDQLEDIAFNGGPMPDLRSQAQCVLFQAFRNLYSYAKRVNMPPEQGRREKNEILKAYEINRFLEDMQEKDIQTRKRVELAAAEYAKNPSVETADKFYEAFYRVKRKKASQ
jgi:uncharacterized membrane protein